MRFDVDLPAVHFRLEQCRAERFDLAQLLRDPEAVLSAQTFEFSLHCGYRLIDMEGWLFHGLRPA